MKNNDDNTFLIIFVIILLILMSITMKLTGLSPIHSMFLVLRIVFVILFFVFVKIAKKRKEKHRNFYTIVFAISILFIIYMSLDITNNTTLNKILTMLIISIIFTKITYSNWENTKLKK